MVMREDGIVGLSQALNQRVKKPVLIFSAEAMLKLGYTHIFVADEICTCLLGH